MKDCVEGDRSWEGLRVLNVKIRRPRIEDIKQLKEFFRIVIIDTFTKEGIGEKLDAINDEIKVKEKLLESDLESKW